MTSEYNPKRLYKSRQNRMIAGVCGGVAEFFNIDPSIVRVLCVLSIFLGGTGILLYIIAMILVPTNPDQEVTAAATTDTVKFWGLLLIATGIFLLLDNLELFPWLDWSKVLSWKFAVSLSLITVGILFIVSHMTRASNLESAEPSSTESTGPQERHQLHRSIRNRKVLGVCEGIAEYFEIDPSIVRLLFVVLTLTSFGFGILAYIILAIVLPEERFGTTSA